MNAKKNPDPHLVEEPVEDDCVEHDHAEALETVLREDADADAAVVEAALQEEDPETEAAVMEAIAGDLSDMEDELMADPEILGLADDDETALAELDSISDIEDRDSDQGIDYKLRDACRRVATNQLEVNTLMAGADWVQRAWEHESIDYRMAALDEMQEFWTSAWNFKWWDKKNSTIDYPNARMELVDILHFIVSEDLVVRLEGELPDPSLRVVTWVSDAMLEGIYAADDSLGEEVPEEARVSQLKSAMMRFIHLLSGEEPEVSWVDFWKMVLLSCPTGRDRYLGEVWKVINLYRAKAVLNKFRTVHRASARGYKKVWIDGREDNDIMMSWLEQQPETPTDQELLQWLQQMYSRVIGV